MNRIACLFSILMLGAVFAANAQFTNTTTGKELVWGPQYKQPRNTYLGKIITPYQGGFFTIRQGSGGLFRSNVEKAYIEYFDSEMKLKKSEELNLKYKKKRTEFETIVYFNRELFMLSSFNNLGKKRKYLFAQKIDKDRLTQEKKLDMVAEVETGSRFPGNYRLTISNDSSHLLILANLPYKRKESERFEMSVYTGDFEKKWTKSIILPYRDDVFTIEKFKVDNQGNVFIMGILGNTNQETSIFQRRSSPDYQYIILQYAAGGGEVKEYKMAIADKFITDLTMDIGRDGNLVCAGFFSEKNSTSVGGTYYFRINTQTKEVINLNLKAFDFDFLTQDLNDRQKARALDAEREDNNQRKAELERYKLDELVLRSDGGALLIAEQFYIVQRTFQNWDGTLQTDYQYNYNDIIVINIKPSGEIEWAARIPKFQRTLNDNGYYSSYAHAIVRDKIYFVFNGNPRNLEPQRGRSRTYNVNGSNSLVTLGEVSKDGSVALSPLFINKDEGLITRPKVCRQMGKNQMIIFGESGNNFKFGRLTF